ncbi:MAG: hypothetical protein COB13_003550 [OCS116 cluster bacterium]|nr:hypothetical protein [OCS116 cluster bacterium]
MPAILWGVTAIFQKLSATASLGPGRYLTLLGLVVFIGGLLYSYFTNEVGFNLKGSLYALYAGACFALATGLMSYALWHYGVPISRITPILSANVLIPVAAGIWLFGEGGRGECLAIVSRCVYGHRRGCCGDQCLN